MQIWAEFITTTLHKQSGVNSFKDASKRRQAQEDKQKERKTSRTKGYKNENRKIKL